MMGLTLILVLLAIRLGEKIASYYDKKVQKDRLDSLREKPYMTSTQIKKNQWYVNTINLLFVIGLVKNKI